jgi:hypothetical protein
MQAAIPYGQFVGGLVGAAFFVIAGAWCLYVWPRSIRRRIDRGDVDAFDGLEKLRKAPLFGYMFLLIAIADTVGTLDQVGALGRAWVGVVLLWVVVIAMFLVVRRLWRHTN